jgi:hypothetical protein
MGKHIIVKSETHLSDDRISRCSRDRVKPARSVQAGKICIPGEVSKVTFNYMQKSAAARLCHSGGEVIVVVGNELISKSEVSQAAKDRT